MRPLPGSLRNWPSSQCSIYLEVRIYITREPYSCKGPWEERKETNIYIGPTMCRALCEVLGVQRRVKTIPAMEDLTV